MTSFMLSGTTASKISSQLTQLRHQMGTPAVGMVLTLVVVCDESNQYDAVQAATEAARSTPPGYWSSSSATRRSRTGSTPRCGSASPPRAR